MSQIGINEVIMHAKFYNSCIKEGLNPMDFDVVDYGFNDSSDTWWIMFNHVGYCYRETEDGWCVPGQDDLYNSYSEAIEVAYKLEKEEEEEEVDCIPWIWNHTEYWLDPATANVYLPIENEEGHYFVGKRVYLFADGVYCLDATAKEDDPMPPQ